MLRQHEYASEPTWSSLVPYDQFTDMGLFMLASYGNTDSMTALDMRYAAEIEVGIREGLAKNNAPYTMYADELAVTVGRFTFAALAYYTKEISLTDFTVEPYIARAVAYGIDAYADFSRSERIRRQLRYWSDPDDLRHLELIEEALGDLSHEQRHIYLEHIMYGRDIEDIAEEYNATPGIVLGVFARAETLMQNALPQSVAQ